MRDNHKERQQKLKAHVDAQIKQAHIEKGLLLVLTGNGKGKSSSAFGMIARACGHGQRCAVAQFIKGDWPCGERNLLQAHGVTFFVMNTGFTWETQDKASDTLAAQQVWQQCKTVLSDPTVDVVLLDELTYMITYGYLELEDVVQSLTQRPATQSVIITGRAAHRTLLEMADTVSEVRNVKHAFDAQIKARQGIDW
ncbi:MAG: cob(I)yrinic acid a,c-diamide adenosyltransferase [Vibrionaceae bacterium]